MAFVHKPIMPDPLELHPVGRKIRLGACNYLGLRLRIVLCMHGNAVPFAFPVFLCSAQCQLPYIVSVNAKQVCKLMMMTSLSVGILSHLWYYHKSYQPQSQVRLGASTVHGGKPVLPVAPKALNSRRTHPRTLYRCMCMGDTCFKAVIV